MDKKETKKRILVVVDMQKDFIDGVLGNDNAKGIEPKVCDLIAKGEWSDIMFTFDAHDEKEYPNTLEGRIVPAHCIIDNDNHGVDMSENVADAIIYVNRNKDTDVYHDWKDRFGCERLLNLIERKYGKDYSDGFSEDAPEIYICGLCTSICVLANAILLRWKFKDAVINIIEDACADVTKEMHDAAITAMGSQMCQITSVEEVLS